MFDWIKKTFNIKRKIKECEQTAIVKQDVATVGSKNQVLSENDTEKVYELTTLEKLSIDTNNFYNFNSFDKKRIQNLLSADKFYNFNSFDKIKEQNNNKKNK